MIAPTLDTNLGTKQWLGEMDAIAHGASHSYQFAQTAASVRRLTPTECLRLQGMPDDHLDLDPPLSDGAKYRMAGNAVTASVAEWIGRRLIAVEAEAKRRQRLAARV